MLLHIHRPRLFLCAMALLAATLAAPTHAWADDCGAATNTGLVEDLSQVVAQTPQSESNAAADARLTDLNSMRPGSAAATAPAADLSSLAAKGYHLFAVASLEVLNSDPNATNHDATLSNQVVGPNGYDVVTNGGFTYDTPGRYHMNPAGAVVRDGVLDTSGVDKAKYRGAVAILEDGTVVVGRGQGSSLGAIQATFGSESNPVRDYMGGGALLIEGGQAVSSQDLYTNQRFDQGGNGIGSSQMRSTNHTLVGIRDGQAWVMVNSSNKSGATLQAELLAAGFDAVVKFDGGSGCFLNDGRVRYRGTDALGLGIKTK